ncbi:uncharacterized protein ATC70_000901 [Mucor velutinosus]|uniref:rhizopuspepsin n=1 Tax=Mucor velutinosus TaxID=708070 RepID=A0AAN7DHF8_9FUNG|nr:hypothetical protein ATC70_000901 [Mucor velutinosus]
MKAKLLLITASIATVTSLPTTVPTAIHLPLRHTRHSSFGKRSLLTGNSNEIPLINDLDLCEVAVKVQIGTPAQEFVLLFDTGSADTWIPSQQCTTETGCPDFLHHYDTSASTSHQKIENDTLSITYGIGSAEGHYFQDIVSLGDQYINRQQTLAMIDKAVGPISQQNQSTDVDHVFLDGIFGAGLPAGTVSYLHGGDMYDPLIVALYKSKTIPNPVFSVSIAQDDTEGSVILGDTHPGYSYIYTAAVGSRWSAYITDFEFQTANETKNFQFNQKTPFGIDTGSNFMYLPGSLAQDLAKSITQNSTLSQEKSGIYVVDCQFQDSQDLVKIYFPSSDYEGKRIFISIPVKELISKRESDGKCLLLFLPSDDKFILGNMLLRHFITVYDFGGSAPRIGFSPVNNNISTNKFLNEIL